MGFARHGKNRMMRRGFKLVRVAEGDLTRSAEDRSITDFVDTMRYGNRTYATRNAYLEHYSHRWIRELRGAIRTFLSKDRKVLSIGSGECEFEVPLHLEGFQIVGSDVAPAALEQVRRLFPEFRTVVLDILKPDLQERFDDVLIPGLDFYFSEDGVRSIFRNAQTLLMPGGRILLVLRYRDNWITRFIDYVGIPLEYLARNARELLRNSGARYRFKLHGYRRHPRELIALAQQTGLRFRRLLHAGFGMELSRLHLDRFPKVFDWLGRLDSRLHWTNNAILLEFSL
jgi:SAM-dependent methyltransferase